MTCSEEDMKYMIRTTIGFSNLHGSRIIMLNILRIVLCQYKLFAFYI